MGSPRLVVLGVGNTLLGDEGFGVYVVRELSKQSLPAGVQVVEGGVGGFSLLDVLACAPSAILVDAADMGLEPGTLKGFTPGDVNLEEAESRLSLHQIGLADVLRMAHELGYGTDLIIIGFQPLSISPGDGLSQMACGKLDEAVGMVLDEVAQSLARQTNSEGV